MSTGREPSGRQNKTFDLYLYWEAFRSEKKKKWSYGYNICFQDWFRQTSAQIYLAEMGTCLVGFQPPLSFRGVFQDAILLAIYIQRSSCMNTQFSLKPDFGIAK